MPPNAFFLRTRDLLVSQNRRKDTFFPHPPSPFHGNFLQLQQYWHLYCFAILGSTSTVIHNVKQRLLRNRPGSALRPLATSCAKDYKAQTSFAESPNSDLLTGWFRVSTNLYPYPCNRPTYHQIRVIKSTSFAHSKHSSGAV